MIQGTASGAGKTTIALGLCRIFRQDGFKAAPFKSQNMTGNTARTACGGEIAVSQLMQAYAAGAEPVTEMNPLVLKPPDGGEGTRVILNGRPFDMGGSGNINDFKISAFLPEIIKAYNSLKKQYDIIVIEGAGSPVELNLIADDIVNMGIARRVNAPVILVADIDRGGAFASLYGTIGLLDERDRKLVKATALNRFRGDISGFEEGRRILERITGLPVAGIVPYVSFDLPEEDGFSLRGERRGERGEFGFESGECRVEGGEFGFDRAELERQFDIVADNVRRALDMDLIYEIVGIRNES